MLTLGTYAMYTVRSPISLMSSYLPLTAIFVAFGLFYYMRMVYVEGKGEQPEVILTSDPWFLLNAVGWLAVTLYLVHG